MGKLKPCPFCGEIAELEKRPLWHGSHGYSGCYEFVIQCKKCGCKIDLGKNDTIYRSEDAARDNAIEAWNRRALDAQDVPDTNVGDTISRQAAIDAFEDTTYTKNEIQRRLSELPPAQPERKKGHWIESHEHAYIGNGVKEWTNWYCSECDAPNDKPTDFCPSCWADMRGEENG